MGIHCSAFLVRQQALNIYWSLADGSKSSVLSQVDPKQPVLSLGKVIRNMKMQDTMSKLILNFNLLFILHMFHTNPKRSSWKAGIERRSCPLWMASSHKEAATASSKQCHLRQWNIISWKMHMAFPASYITKSETYHFLLVPFRIFIHLCAKFQDLV